MTQLFAWIDGFLNGKKTLIGIIAGIASFILVVTKVLGDGFQFDDVRVISEGFAALMIAIGLAHKADKAIDAGKK